MKSYKKFLVVTIILVLVLLVGCTQSPLSKTNELDTYWLESNLAWTEQTVAELQGTTNPAAERSFLRSLESIENQTLLDAWDQYSQTYFEYIYGDTPEEEWEKEWEKVESSMLNFYEAYISELRAYLETRQ